MEASLTQHLSRAQGHPGAASGPLTSRQKAAVIVRLLVAEGVPLPLSSLPEHLQAALTEQIGLMRSVDRETLRATVEEFLEELERIGLSFPGGLTGALDMLDGQLSASAASRIRRMGGGGDRNDAWDRIAALPVEQLMPVLEEESPEVAAVMLSKLNVAKAAELLGKLPGERARRVAYAISLTARIDPDTVMRIGQSLSAGLDALPPQAFEGDPVERVGAILNISPQATREEVLEGLDAADAEFAGRVRKAIFTFPHIPSRVEGRDVPKLLRVVPQQVLVVAFAGAAGDEEGQAAVEFLLDNISQRMASAIREEMGGTGKVKPKDAEEAQAAVVAAIRELETAGEIVLVQPEEAG